VRPILLDADAFINLRTLSVGSASMLEILLQRSKQQERAVYLTQYIAEHDLSDLQQEVASLTSAGLFEVSKLQSSDPAYRDLRKQVDKGEAEAIAWALTWDAKERPLLVARDTEALKCAKRNGVPATDLMGLMVELVESGLITKQEAKRAADPWNDPGQQLGKPRNYKGFDVTFAARRSRGAYYYP